MPAQSTAEALGDAAKAAVLAITLAGTTTAKRKTPSLPEGATPPQVVVSVSDEQPTERLTAVHKRRKVRFAITVVTGGGQKLGEDATVLKWLEQIDDAIFDKQLTTFATVAGFVHLKHYGGTVYDPTGLSKDFNYSLHAYEAEVIETLAT